MTEAFPTQAEVAIPGERVPATLSLTPFYDPAGETLRS